jgi:hypothetical protein
MRNELLVGGVGILLLGSVLWIRSRQPAIFTNQELIQLAQKEDPPIQQEISGLKAILKVKSGVLAYLPECTSCSVSDPIPNPLPNSMLNAVFVKRSSADIPKQTMGHQVIIDDDGKYQRILNAYRLPRLYYFENGKLTSLQKVDESVQSFLDKVER